MSPVTVCLFAFLLVFAPVYGRYRIWKVEEKRADGVASKIAAASARLQDCLKNDDENCLGDLYTEDFILLPQGHRVIYGELEAVMYLEWFESGDEVTFTTTDVQPADPAAMFVSERFVVQSTDKETNKVMEGKGLRIWKKDGDSYKIYMSMFNADCSTGNCSADN